MGRIDASQLVHECHKPLSCFFSTKHRQKCPTSSLRDMFKKVCFYSMFRPIGPDNLVSDLCIPHVKIAAHWAAYLILNGWCWKMLLIRWCGSQLSISNGSSYLFCNIISFLFCAVHGATRQQCHMFWNVDSNLTVFFLTGTIKKNMFCCSADWNLNT